jgi:hypothetical protein
VRKISPPPAFNPRTVQPVASCHTDWAIPARIFRDIDCVLVYCRLLDGLRYWYVLNSGCVGPWWTLLTKLHLRSLSPSIEFLILRPDNEELRLSPVHVLPTYFCILPMSTPNILIAQRLIANTTCRYWQALWTLWLTPEDDLKEINVDRRVEASSVVVRAVRGASSCSLSVVNWNLCCTRRWMLNLFWRWRWQVSPKSFCLSTRSYVATSQKTSIFIFTSNLCY